MEREIDIVTLPSKLLKNDIVFLILNTGTCTLKKNKNKNSCIGFASETETEKYYPFVSYFVGIADSTF